MLIDHFLEWGKSYLSGPCIASLYFEIIVGISISMYFSTNLHISRNNIYWNDIVACFYPIFLIFYICFSVYICWNCFVIYFPGVQSNFFLNFSNILGFFWHFCFFLLFFLGEISNFFLDCSGISVQYFSISKTLFSSFSNFHFSLLWLYRFYSKLQLKKDGINNSIKITYKKMHDPRCR